MPRQCMSLLLAHDVLHPRHRPSSESDVVFSLQWPDPGVVPGCALLRATGALQKVFARWPQCDAQTCGERFCDVCDGQGGVSPSITHSLCGRHQIPLPADRLVGHMAVIALTCPDMIGQQKHEQKLQLRDVGGRLGMRQGHFIGKLTEERAQLRPNHHMRSIATRCIAARALRAQRSGICLFPSGRAAPSDLDARTKHQTARVGHLDVQTIAHAF